MKNPTKDLVRAWPLMLALLAPLAPAQTPAPVPDDTPSPGTLALQVDATDLDRRIFRVRESVPVAPGPLTLLYPQWLPGNHSPNGVISALAGLQIRAGGRSVAWRRDPVDMHAFHLDVPAGVSALDLDFQFLSPVNSERGQVVMTPDMLDVSWSSMLLYPAGHLDARIVIQPTLKLPEGWGFGTALETAAQRGAVVEFKPVSVETLIDSPVFAGRQMTRVDLDPQATASGRAPVYLSMMADTAGELVVKPEQLAAHRALVTQADRLFGARHFARYEFLLAISDSFGGVGLEHHQSSENGVQTGYFSEWDKAGDEHDQIAHEYVHSWNGKFRRPADLWTPNTNTPMQDSLLWLYEGQTQFWGTVLAARSGLVPIDETLEGLAVSAAWVDGQSGRAWRDLQDTTNAEIITNPRQRGLWNDWQRGSSDYYVEGLLIWLEADMRIREASKGARSLDDFARAFFGVEPGRVAPLLYTFDDVVATLNRVQPMDWAGFLRSRLDSHTSAPLDGLTRAGWRLAWADEPNGASKGFAARRKFDDFEFSLGITIGKGGRLQSVRWGSPAFDAGLSVATDLLAVDGRAYSVERMKDAITAAKTGTAPIQLLVRDGDLYKTVAITYRGGLRYPKLERIANTDDRLTPLLKPKS
jgi:predicted metalloprotease with PDZ domain